MKIGSFGLLDDARYGKVIVVSPTRQTFIHQISDSAGSVCWIWEDWNAQTSHAAVAPFQGPSAGEMSEDLHFSVCCWNVLADKYARQSSFPYCAKSHLAWAHRGPAIAFYLGRIDADVFCLQEVDRVAFFEDWFTARGTVVVCVCFANMQVAE